MTAEPTPPDLGVPPLAAPPVAGRWPVPISDRSSVAASASPDAALAESRSWVTPEPGLDAGSEAEVCSPWPPSPPPLEASSGGPP